MATGRKNGWNIEINGSEGSIYFMFEDMNYLDYYSRRDGKNERGFRRIIVGEPGHPYMEGHWPPGHGIGYEHTFVNQVVDIVRGIAKDEPLWPDFLDGLRNQEVLDAVLTSCDERSWIPIPK